MAGYDQDKIFVNAARELADKSLEPRIRLYRASSDGLKLRVLKDCTLREIEEVVGGGGMTEIGFYASEEFGKGFYCAKLFCTKYGKNILERRYDFAAGGTRDELLEDEEDSEDEDITGIGRLFEQMIDKL